MTKLLNCLVAIGALVALAATARALPTDQYLKLRRQVGFDPSVTYAAVQAQPASFAGRVLELRGTVDGFVRRDGSISFMLTMDANQAIFLTAPTADANLVSNSNHQPLRVLARVAQGSVGNVVPLEVLAVALDAEVRTREATAAAQHARPQYSAPRRPVSSSPRRSSMASRGGYYVRSSSPAAYVLSALAQQYLSPAAQQIYPAYKSYILRCNPRLTEQELDTITVCVLNFGERYRVDPRLVIAVIIAESDFNPRSTSNKGAMGLGQIMPDEAAANHLTNAYDPVQNIGTAVALLRDKLDRYRTHMTPDGQYTEEQIKLALAAYNAGPGAVRKYHGVPPYRETQAYIRRILKKYSELCSQD